MQHEWESGGEGASEGGWVSFDRRWFWDGVAWQPVPSANPASPGRRGFLPGVAVGCLAAAIAGVVLVIGLPLVLVLVLVFSGEAPPPEPTVDWSHFPSGTHERIDALAEDMNCHGLEQELAAAEHDADRVGARDLTRYIEYQMDNNAFCYGFGTESPQPG